MSEHDFEPIRGLPGTLPPDERLLWQGAPDWLTLASQVFHIRAVGAYFLALLAWRFAEGAASGATLGAMAVGAVGVALVAALGLGLLLGLAFLIAKTTVYTVTSKRVVMRFGVALPKAINIPYTVIEGAAVTTFGATKSGNLALSLKKPNKIAYLHLWPHARPTRLRWPEPTFRALPNAQEAASVLAGALLAHREQQAPVPQSEPTPQQEPVAEAARDHVRESAAPLLIDPLRTAPA